MHFFEEFTIPADGYFIVTVPVGITSEKTLYEFYADVLGFPGWFGYNWDAFLDCLRDIDAVSGKNIVIQHDDLPFESDPTNQAIYLDILLSTQIRHRGKVIVTFPVDMQDRVDRVILDYWKSRCPDVENKEDVTARICDMVLR